MFEPITSTYGIDIVYEIDKGFLSSLKNPGIPAGPSNNSLVEPIRHRILARYPALLKKALDKYPVGIITKYLGQINFAEEINEDGFKYSGSFDPFRRVIYMVDDGTRPDKDAIHTFHHEFSSLLLARHSFLLNPWTDNHPDEFKYMVQLYDSVEERIKARKSITDFYEKGIVSNYGLTSFENDFNEFSAMIFTYPEKFKKIMKRYPRVRGKFLVWLEFYQKIDPIFTEEYFLGKN
jgi:hypothetical protein